MNSAADEDDVDHFLNTSSRILDEYDRGIDVSEEVRLLELPSECTPGICKIYTEIKKLLPADEAPVHRLSFQDTARPETPSHRRCVHYVAPPPQNTGLQLRDFLYLFICLTFGFIVYRVMYNPDYHRRDPIY